VNGDTEEGFLTTVILFTFYKPPQNDAHRKLGHLEYCYIPMILIWNSTDEDIGWCYFLNELKGAFPLSRDNAYRVYPSVLRSLPAGGTILPAMLSAFRCRSFDNLFTTWDICPTYTLDDEVTASSYISFLPFPFRGQLVLRAILNSYNINFRTKINCRILWWNS
jgi:hypothetical protein